MGKEKESDFEHVLIPKMEYKEQKTLEGHSNQISALYTNINYLRDRLDTIIGIYHKSEVKQVKDMHKLMLDFTKIVEEKNKEMIKPLQDDIKEIKESEKNYRKITDERLDKLENKETEKVMTIWNKFKNMFIDKFMVIIIGGIMSLLMLNGLVQLIMDILK